MPLLVQKVLLLVLCFHLVMAVPVQAYAAKTAKQAREAREAEKQAEIQRSAQQVESLKLLESKQDALLNALQSIHQELRTQTLIYNTILQELRKQTAIIGTQTPDTK